MPEGAVLAFGFFISVVFMAVGVLGIYRKREFSKSVQSMYRTTGIMVDYNVRQYRDEDNYMRDAYFPIYEYEWGGIRKRLESPTKVLRVKIGRQVQILIDPRTEKAICLEEQKASNSFLVIFGIIGVLTFILMLMLVTGILS